VKKSEEHGLYVHGTLNSVVKNVLKKSAGFDLYEDPAYSGNIYLKNKCGTSNL